MVKKHVLFLVHEVWEDGRPVVTGNGRGWIHKDEKTWTDYDATIQAIRDAGFVYYDSLNDRLDKQLRDVKKDD